MIQLLLPALLGAGIFPIGWFQFRKVQASRSWPYTPGRIIAATTESSTTLGQQGEPDITSFHPAIQYEYVVENQYLRGSRIAFDQKTYSTPRKAQEALQAFQIGASVWVFYDPASPTQCVLERKSSSGTVLMIVGGVIVVAGIIALVMK